MQKTLLNDSTTSDGFQTYRLAQLDGELQFEF